MTGIAGCDPAAAAFSRATRAAGCWDASEAGSLSGRQVIDHLPGFGDSLAGAVSRTCSTRLSSSSCWCPVAAGGTFAAW